MEMGSNSGPGLVPGQTESGGSSTESSSFSGGLMFGQKIYFEDGGGGGGGGSGSSSSGGSNRRVRGGGSGSSGQIPRCQVEGCGMDLTNAKGYYSRHRVCGIHSKTPKVIVSGLEQRFCQQCSRFFVISISTLYFSRLFTCLCHCRRDNFQSQSGQNL